MAMLIILQAYFSPNNQNIGKSLLAAALRGEVARFDKLINEGAQREFADEQGLTALHQACLGNSANCARIVKSLLDAKVDQSPSSTHGTPLAIAALMGHADLVDILLQHGASAREESLNIGSALHAACHGGDSFIVERLLAQGASVRSIRMVREEFGSDLKKGDDMPPRAFAHRVQPFHVAAAEGHIHLLEYLKERGAAIDARCSYWNVQSDLSARADTHNTAAIWDNRTSLMRAASDGNNEVIRKLLAMEANVDAQDSEGLTALMLAVQNNRAACVRSLLVANASIYPTDINGQSLVQLATRSGSAECIEILAERMSVVGYKPSILHEAAQFGHHRVAAVLIKAGIDVDVEDHDGNTPLIYAAYYDQANVARTFLAHGANCWHRNSKKGRFPMVGHKTLLDINGLGSLAPDGPRFPYGNASEVAETQGNRGLAEICKGDGHRWKKVRASVKKNGELAAAFGLFPLAPVYAVGKFTKAI